MTPAEAGAPVEPGTLVSMPPLKLLGLRSSVSTTTQQWRVSSCAAAAARASSADASARRTRSRQCAVSESLAARAAPSSSCVRAASLQV